MARKVLGPRGGRRRRGLLFVPFLAACAIGLFVITSAQAVHDTGLFQLDSDAFQANVPSGFLGGNDDWDSVCKAHLGSGNGAVCNQAPNTTLDSSISADKSTFITDAFNADSDNIYKGGTDDADVSTWLWKQAKPSPSKADIEQAYAAQYTGTAAPYLNHKLLFFGGTRYANNGDTNIGLWFFHNKVTGHGVSAGGTDDSPTCSQNNGCGFSGVHTEGNCSLPNHPNPCTPGDIFILSAFTGGGSEPTIKVFEWVGAGKATKNYLGSNNCFTNACTLQPLSIPNTPGFTDNRCDGSTVTGDVACAIVNAGEISSPWLFQDSGPASPANKIEANEFYEGGLDLTGLGFGDACFSSVLLNTRSSQSGTSVLQDFALGGFGSCSSSVVTTPSVGSNGVSIGTGSVSVTDSAQVTVQGISSFTGTLAFHLCGPIATGNCSTGGTAVAAGAGVNPVTANGSYSSASATVTSAGRYCWRADFTSGTTGVPNASDPSDTTSTTECFVVNPVTPPLDTAAVASPVDFGQAVQDNATLSGTATQPGNPIINGPAGAAAGGTITFTLLKADCTTLATGTGLNPQSVNVSGDGTYGPVSFTPDAPGTYHWKAVYAPASGDPNNLGSTHNGSCNDTDETVVVNQIPTVTTTRQFVYPQDKASINTNPAGGTLNGNVTFKLFDTSANCTANGDTVGQGGLLYKSAALPISGAGPKTATTSNTTAAVTTNTTVYWRVTYVSNNQAQTGSSSACTEQTTVSYTGNDSNITVP